MTGPEYAISYGFLGFGVLVAASWVWFYARSGSVFRRKTVIAASVLFAFGWVTFTAISIAATGGMDWIPSSFEWPVGSTSDFIHTSDGGYAVALQSAGRIQVYDAQARFLRGWQTDTRGGEFTLTPLPEGGIEMYAFRRDRVLAYDPAGHEIPIASRPHAGPPKDWPGTTSMSFGGRWWLWPIESPAYAFIFMVIGFVLLGLSARKQDTARNSTQSQAPDPQRWRRRSTAAHKSRGA